MAIIINDNYCLTATKPFDNRYLNVTQPWASCAAAIAGIPTYRYTGLTININGEEWWWKNGVTDSDLIQKSFGGGATSVANGLSTSGTYIVLGGTLTGNTTFSSASNYHLKYGGDYSANYTARSIIDAAYVTGKTSAVLSCLTTNYYTKTQINNYTGTTVPNTYYNKTQINNYTGTTVPNTYYNKTQINNYTGTTVPNTYYNKTQINSYTAATNIRITNVETVTSVAITGATNGLTKLGRVAILGGALTGNTCVYSTNSSCCAYINFNKSLSNVTLCSKGGSLLLDSSSLSGAGGKICITAPSGMTYAADYCSNYTSRSIVDKEYVDKKVNIACVRTTSGVCPFYINSNDYYIGVNGYAVSSCGCIYLVSSPSVGQKIVIADIQGGALDYPITIDGNGICINGNTSGIATINTDYGSITFIYNGTFWSAVAFVN